MSDRLFGVEEVNALKAEEKAKLFDVDSYEPVTLKDEERQRGTYQDLKFYLIAAWLMVGAVALFPFNQPFNAVAYFWLSLFLYAVVDFYGPAIVSWFSESVQMSAARTWIRSFS